MTDTQPSWVVLRSDDLTAEINPFGAQLSRLRDGAGRDLLWDGNPAVWAGRAPVLFPIVGTLAGGSYLFESKRYALSRHGFARNMPFETVTATGAAAVFRLRATDATRAVYPFEFELDVRFALAGAELSVTATVRNVGERELPASLGFHPGFRWPLPFGETRESHFLRFDVDETAPARRIDAQGLVSAELHPTPIVRGRLALSDELFTTDVLIFDQLKGHSVSYGSDKGPRLEIRYPDAEYLGIWTKPGSEFLCIEPWQGISDPAGFTGDIRQKPGIFQVSPGSEHSLSMSIVLI